MDRNRFSLEQIVAALKRVRQGASVDDVIRSLQISELTFYRWKKQYGLAHSSEANKAYASREKDTELPRLVVELPDK